MKESKYNIFLEKKNCVLCYNSLTNNYLVVPIIVYNHLKNENIVTFQNEYPRYYDSFTESGFIIEEEFDELGNIRMDNRMKVFNPDEYFVSILVISNMYIDKM
jgi:hypothetical protein